jgi:hypothetical protein
MDPDAVADRQTTEYLLASYVLRRYDDGASIDQLATDHRLSREEIIGIMDHWRPSPGLVGPGTLDIVT